MQRFGYADTPRGQLHYREAGRGEPFVLLHWAPGSSAQYAAVIEALAAAGTRGIALDLPGFGASYRRVGHWTIGDFADSVIECLDALDLRRCVLVGGHLSSLIAIEAALRAAQRFVYIGLDGTPTWDERTRRDILDKALPAPLVPTEDGAHLLAEWRHLLWEVRMWRPRVPFDDALAQFAMNLLRARMMADFDLRPAQALLEYDALGALRRLTVPVLALAADDDP
ncbi:MAG: alpha/beta fold hydrolase, partial [Steroidobacteraceae bacterium]|nr:alpha/beta fold hydrolase [Steroidobacteraceae bacterium]